MRGLGDETSSLSEQMPIRTLELPLHEIVRPIIDTTDVRGDRGDRGPCIRWRKLTKRHVR